eukprot:11948415-Alexandrium_andersonii.AAC.1
MLPSMSTTSSMCPWLVLHSPCIHHDFSCNCRTATGLFGCGDSCKCRRCESMRALAGTRRHGRDMHGHELREHTWQMCTRMLK